jgi:hypothetical protein
MLHKHQHNLTYRKPDRAARSLIKLHLCSTDILG